MPSLFPVSAMGAPCGHVPYSRTKVRQHTRPGDSRRVRKVPLGLRAVAPPSVSIILPIYNEHETIDSVLASLLAQDYPGPLEIVVADGGSDDGTKELLAAWVERDDRVRVVDNPQRRQSPGLDRGGCGSRR